MWDKKINPEVCGVVHVCGSVNALASPRAGEAGEKVVEGLLLLFEVVCMRGCAGRGGAGRGSFATARPTSHAYQLEPLPCPGQVCPVPARELFREAC